MDLWNSLPAEAKLADSIGTFKKTNQLIGIELGTSYSFDFYNFMIFIQY